MTFSISQACLICVLACGAAHAQSLQLSIEFDKAEYVVREPLRVRAELTNNSTEEVRIMEVRYLGPEMNHVWLELIRPDGTQEARISKWWYESILRNRGYRGEPLAPGARVVFFLYPVASFPVDPSGMTRVTEDRCGGVAFCETGQYRVRLIYKAPQVYEELWRSGGGEAASDYVEVTITEPTAVEREILDAHWGDRSSWPYMEETAAFAHSDMEALRRVIRQYPDHPLTNHVRLRLASALTWPPGPEESAIEVLEELHREHAPFRRMEVSILLAYGYEASRQDQDGLSVLESVLAEDPSLASCYQFMWRWLSCKYGSTFVPQDLSPVGMWESNRRKGRPFPEKLEPHQQDQE